MKHRAVLYARLSGDDRPKDGRNLANQLDMCRKYAQEKDWQVVAELAEDEAGASGVDFYLPQLETIIRMGEKKLIDILVVREMDRLSRRFAKQILIEENLRKAGVRIEYVLGDYPETPDGQLLKNIRAVISEFEGQKITERSLRGRRLRAQAGNVSHNKLCPYGFRVIEVDGIKTYEVNKAEAEVVKLIFQLYAQGGEDGEPLSQRKVANYINKLGILTPSQSKEHFFNHKGVCTTWKEGSVSNVLNNETYRGVFYWPKFQKKRREHASVVDTGPKIAIKVPEIISNQIWKDTRTRKALAIRRGNGESYLLYRRLRCGECQSIIGVRGSRHSMRKIRLSYKCNRARSKKCSNYRFYPRRWLDPIVYEWIQKELQEILDSPDPLDFMYSSMMGQKMDSNLPISREIRKHKRNLDRTFNLYLAGALSKESLEKECAKSDSAIRNLEREWVEYIEQINSFPIETKETDKYRYLKEELEKILQKGEKEKRYRKVIINRLDVRGVLSSSDRQLFAHMTSLIGDLTFTMKTRY